MDVCRIQARQQKVSPVERRDFVQRGDDIVKRVGLDHRSGARRAMKALAEIIQRFRAVRQLANLRVHVEPDQPAFIIKIDAAPNRGPFFRSVVKQLRGDRRIDQRPRHASGLVIEIRRDFGKLIAILLRRPEAAARRKQIAEVLSQSFVNPKQLALHRLLIIRRRQSRRPAILAVP